MRLWRGILENLEKVSTTTTESATHKEKKNSHGKDVHAVLLGEGHLHGWDLRGGTFLGQWRIGKGNYTSMCHGTHQMVLAQREGRLGPKLHVAELPAAFSQDSQFASVQHDQWHFLGN